MTDGFNCQGTLERVWSKRRKICLSVFFLCWSMILGASFLVVLGWPVWMLKRFPGIWQQLQRGSKAESDKLCALRHSIARLFLWEVGWNQLLCLKLWLRENEVSSNSPESLCHCRLAMILSISQDYFHSYSGLVLSGEHRERNIPSTTDTLHTCP